MTGPSQPTRTQSRPRGFLTRVRRTSAAQLTESGAIRSPALGVVAAAVAGASVLMGLRAWARRHEQRARPSQRLRHAASWTGSQVARLSARAVQPLAARPDLTAELAAGLMLEAS